MWLFGTYKERERERERERGDNLFIYAYRPCGLICKQTITTCDDKPETSTKNEETKSQSKRGQTLISLVNAGRVVRSASPAVARPRVPDVLLLEGRPHGSSSGIGEAGEGPLEGRVAPDEVATLSDVGGEGSQEVSVP